MEGAKAAASSALDWLMLGKFKKSRNVHGLTSILEIVVFGWRNPVCYHVCDFPLGHRLCSFSTAQRCFLCRAYVGIERWATAEVDSLQLRKALSTDRACLLRISEVRDPQLEPQMIRR